MGKSTSCFNLITCGSDAADKDDYQVFEIKDSNDRRGWSFRKRSARHRALNNTAITEIPSSVNKESSQCTSMNFQPPADTNVIEKIYERHCSDEKPHLSFLANSQISETVVTETESKQEVNPPESVVVIIQAAIRMFLAQKALVKHKNVVKLQAAIRGHLVRRHAIGTLRCVQAIIKMQVLVRARRAQQSLSENHLSQKHGKNDSLKTLGNENHTPLQKLLGNGFARQLLESTPKGKPIYVKCDPSKADSAWKWLERWMFVSSSDPVESKNASSVTQQSDYSKVMPSWVGEKLITDDADNFSFHVNHSTSFLIKDNLEQALPVKTITPSSTESAPQELDFLPLLKTEIDEQAKRSTKRFASYQLESEIKKLVYGSRKASNHAFIAAQSKFEELSLMENLGRLSNFSYQDIAVESQAETSSVGTDTGFRSKESFSLENFASYPSRIAGSECGTELSITSTLDSPDRSEVENDEAKDLPEGICNPDKKINSDVEANEAFSIPSSNLPHSVLNQPEMVDDIDGKMEFSVVAVDSMEPAINSETNVSDMQKEQAEALLQGLHSTLLASPQSHITVSESQGTPSSQVSVKATDGKADKTGSGNRRRSLTAVNKTPANPNHDSGSRASREQLPKDQQIGKGRNSFSSLKSDHIDQEPRDYTSSTNSLPHFMQATESAKAKINANNSPRSNPEVHDQDIHVKKRHSLSGVTGRHGSPRIQRPMPQLHQGTKGNNLHAPHERKWQR